MQKNLYKSPASPISPLQGEGKPSLDDAALRHLASARRRKLQDRAPYQQIIDRATAKWQWRLGLRPPPRPRLVLPAAFQTKKTMLKGFLSALFASPQPRAFYM